MASSLLMSFAPATVRVYAATAKGAAGGSKEEKGFLDWVLGNLQKEDQFYETDPILKKVEEKGTTTNGSGSGSGGRGTIRGNGKNSVVVPQKKNGGFGGLGGLFAKK